MAWDESLFKSLTTSATVLELRRPITDVAKLSENRLTLMVFGLIDVVMTAQLIIHLTLVVRAFMMAWTDVLSSAAILRLNRRRPPPFVGVGWLH